MLLDIQTDKTYADGTAFRLEPGVYSTSGAWLPDQVGSIYFRKGPFSFGMGTYGVDDQGVDAAARREFSTFYTYGTCDAVEQIRDFYGSLLDLPDLPVVIETRLIPKAPANDLKWAKTGIYIGDRTPVTASLAEEPDFDEVLLFRIRPLNGLTPADLTRLAQDYYSRQPEFLTTSWDDLTRKQRADAERFVYRMVDLFQTRQEPGMRDEAHHEAVARAYGWQSRKVSEWGTASDEARQKCRRFVAEFVECMQDANVSWLPPFNPLGVVRQHVGELGVRLSQ